MLVRFEVEVSQTEPGEVVLAVGSHPALGAWDIDQALALETSIARFPSWFTSLPLDINGTEGDTHGKLDVEFKFAICDRARTGPVRWEVIPANRRLVDRRSPHQAPEGFAGELLFRATWEDPKSVVTLRASRSRGHNVRFADEDERLTVPGSEEKDAECTSPKLKVSCTRRRSRVPPREPGGPHSCVPSDETAAPPSTVSVSSTAGPLSDIRSGASQSVLENSPVQPGYKGLHPDVPVVIASSEISPWSNTGGLGLVTASFCQQFALRGHRTMAVSPMYTRPAAGDGFKYAGSGWCWISGSDREVRYFHKYISFAEGRGCDYILVDCFCFRDRPQTRGLYCDSQTGKEYEDNLIRFALLSLAALEAPLRLRLGGVAYGERVAFIANDWQAALIPIYLAQKYRRSGVYLRARCIYVIHNLGFRGEFRRDLFPLGSTLGLDESAAADLVQGGNINLSMGAIIFSDRVITVSPNYAAEILTAEGGFGLDEFLRRKGDALRLAGIRNGVDHSWNPRTDEFIARTYCRDNFFGARRECKLALQQSLGLQLDPKAALVGFVGRLAWQKGVDMFGTVVDWLMGPGVQGLGGRAQMIMMGDGEQKYRQLLRELEQKHKGSVCGYAGFEPAVEHRMMAGCDLLVMPSRYEPCGLPQMIAHIYGALPVVSATGGLRDSVQGLHEGLDRATGFLIPAPIDEVRLREGLRQALEVYFLQPGRFQQMQRNAMGCDFRWTTSMDEYERQLDYTLGAPAHHHV